MSCFCNTRVTPSGAPHSSTRPLCVLFSTVSQISSNDDHILLRFSMHRQQYKTTTIRRIEKVYWFTKKLTYIYLSLISVVFATFLITWKHLNLGIYKIWGGGGELIRFTCSRGGFVLYAQWGRGCNFCQVVDHIFLPLQVLNDHSLRDHLNFNKTKNMC